MAVALTAIGTTGRTAEVSPWYHLTWPVAFHAVEPPPTLPQEAPEPPGWDRGAGDPFACIRSHESNGYGDKRNPRYRGAYQAAWSTWGGYAGYTDPADAPPSVQDRWAHELERIAGWSPWPQTSRMCGLR